MLRPELFQLGEHRPDHPELEAVAHVERLRVCGGRDQVAAEVRVGHGVQVVDDVGAQLRAVLDARQQLEVRDHQLVVPVDFEAEVGRGVVERRLPELRREGVLELRGHVADDVLEAVVPEVLDVRELRVVLNQIPRQVEDADDVVVVHVAHHQQLDGERPVLFEEFRPDARLLDLPQALFQEIAVGPARPAVDEGEPRLVLRAVVQQHAVALSGADNVEAE